MQAQKNKTRESQTRQGAVDQNPSFGEWHFEISKDTPRSAFRNKCVFAFSFLISLPKRIYNTYLIIKHGELRKPASKNVCPFRAFTSFPSLFFTFKVSVIPEVMKAFLKYPRNDPENGLFIDKENIQTLFAVMKDLYPEEKLEIDDSVFTCRKEMLNKHRHPILQFIGPNNIKNHREELEKISKKVLEECRKTERVNATELALIFTTSVISRLLLGHPGPLEIYKKISLALDSINKLMLKKVWRQPFSQTEREEYDNALTIVRGAIETSLANKQKHEFGSLVETLQEKKMSQTQIKMALFNMYFAGSETSASLISYLLWQLGRHPEYQEAIYQDISKGGAPLFELAEGSLILNKVFAESIRLFTPAYLIVRRPVAPLICKAKDDQGNVVFEEKIGQEEVLAATPTFAGRNPSRFENPDQFNPNRFSQMPTLDWRPFGDGAHTCPGQWLARSEILIFVASLVKEFAFSSSPEKEPEQKGFTTLKTSEPLWISLSLR